DAIFRSVNSYPHLAGRSLHGNPEASNDTELGEAAREVLDGVYADQLRELAERFEERSAAGRTAGEINDLARAPPFGAGDTLRVDTATRLGGRLDEGSGGLSLDGEERAGDLGVGAQPSGRAAPGGGAVRAVRADEVPGGGPEAAILRYPV